MDKIKEQYKESDCILIKYMKGGDLNNKSKPREHKTPEDFWDKLDKVMKTCIKEYGGKVW